MSLNPDGTNYSFNDVTINVAEYYRM